LVVHSDNAKPHTAKSTIEFMTHSNLTRAEYPPYSPDIAPSDFYLFGYMKRMLKGNCFSTRDELLNAITSILEGIEKKVLESILDEWEKRLTWVFEHKGEYFP